MQPTRAIRERMEDAARAACHARATAPPHACFEERGRCVDRCGSMVRGPRYRAGVDRCFVTGPHTATLALCARYLTAPCAHTFEVSCAVSVPSLMPDEEPWPGAWLSMAAGRGAKAWGAWEPGREGVLTVTRETWFAAHIHGGLVWVGGALLTLFLELEGSSTAPGGTVLLGRSLRPSPVPIGTKH